MAQDIIDKYNLGKYEIDRIVEMAWEDRTPFDAIEFQFGVSEQEVIRIMKDQMKLNNWKKWRSRVSGRKTKHRALRNEGVNRFKSSAQKVITNNRISKKKY
ncbi:MAG: TIGR03643 family protein [Balneolaceae bacterium]|nr:TIGR03643 family protein [Balneolaceae bacterium]